jgi:hypothetical protein
MHFEEIDRVRPAKDFGCMLGLEPRTGQSRIEGQ